MKRNLISVLLVEDNSDDAFFIQDMLSTTAGTVAHFVVTHVMRLSEGLRRLETERFDVALLDLSLPDSHGIETFTRLQKQMPTLPAILLTGLDDDTVALDAVHEGAQDYLIKGQVDANLLTRAIRYAIERKQAEVALARSAADLEQFAYMVSNDMQKSLQTIAEELQQLEQRLGIRIGTTSKRIIANARTASRRVQNLSDALLAYTRTATWGAMLEPVESQEILAQTLATLATTIEQNAATVTYDALPTITADTMQMLQLFQHLILNAINFRSDAPPQIHIGVNRVNSEWVFSVRDNGIGIDMGYMDRIFDPFQRLHAADDLGVGIGLAICKRIIEHHGGRIWVESKPDEGSTFYFTLLASA